MNIVTVAGLLGKDSESRYLSDGKPVLNFTVADSQGKDKPAIWWSCSMFGNRAEAVAPYLLKGTAVTVSGTVTEREWTDKDGNKRKNLDLRVNEIALQGGKREQAPDQRPTAKKTFIGGANLYRADFPASGFEDLKDDIPY